MPDMRTREGRAQRPAIMGRVVAMRRSGHTYREIADDLEIAPATVDALLWDAIGLESISLSRAVARERRDAPRWIVDTNGDPVKLWNGAGRLVTDPALVWVELGLWEALQDGLVTVEFDDEGNSWWGPVNGEQET